MSDLPFSASSDPDWLLIEEGVDLPREREIKSIFAVGNGYFGTRVSIGEDGRFSNPATFVAGVYTTDVSSELGTRLAVLPNWFHTEIKVENQQLSLEAGRVLQSVIITAENYAGRISLTTSPAPSVEIRIEARSAPNRSSPCVCRKWTSRSLVHPCCTARTRRERRTKADPGAAKSNGHGRQASVKRPAWIVSLPSSRRVRALIRPVQL